jgi:Fungal Zn(2)-Cys(6) binuclear cluster domain
MSDRINVELRKDISKIHLFFQPFRHHTGFVNDLSKPDDAQSDYCEMFPSTTPYYHLLITIHVFLGTALVNTLDMILDKKGMLSAAEDPLQTSAVFRLIMQYQNESATIPGRACAYCRKRKRRCDMLRPACSACREYAFSPF